MLMKVAEDESSGRKTDKQADRSDLKRWVRRCQGTKEGNNYTKKLRQSGKWQEIGFLSESSLPGMQG